MTLLLALLLLGWCGTATAAAQTSIGDTEAWSNKCLGDSACSSLTVAHSGAISFVPSPGAPALAGSVAAAGPLTFNATTGSESGFSALGPWQQLHITSAAAECTVRYFPRADAFVFSRQQQQHKQQPWPRFQLTRESDAQWDAIGWSHSAMVAGRTAPSLRALAKGLPPGTQNGTLVGQPGGLGGPVFLSHKQDTPAAKAAVGITALDYFDSNAMLVSASMDGSYRQCCDPEHDDCWLAAGVVAPSIVPTEGVWMSSALVGRPGLQRAIRALGSVIRNVHNTTRLRDASVESLSYWSDNNAGYSFWSVPGNIIEKWGPIGSLYLKLHEEYMKAGIAFGSWETDNTMERLPSIGADGKTHGGWCFTDWTQWNRTLYPTGGSAVPGSLGWAAQMRALQNSTIQSPMAFAYYIYYLCHENVWRRNSSSPFHDAFLDVGPWRGTSKPLNYGRGDQSVTLLHPDRVQAFYLDIMGRAKREWGMGMLFKDDLADQGQRMFQQFPGRFGVRMAWLRGLTGALAQLGLSMQACMTAPVEILASAQNMSALTNARVSGDGGISIASAAAGSVLAAMVGVGWSKDNVKTATTTHNKIGAGFPELQMMLATLSLGPVGLSDPLSGPDGMPYANATITSNISIVKAAIARNGSLLQPSYPITPTASTLLGTTVGQYAVWATFTEVPTGGTGGTGVCYHFTAVGFVDSTDAALDHAAVAPAPPVHAQAQCGWVEHADKVSGHNFKIITNKSRAECCAACFALPTQCECYVRDPSDGTCYLITGTVTNATRHSGNREVGFTNRPPPPPTPHGFWPAVDLLPLVDGTSTEATSFSQPPEGFFRGSGADGDGRQYVYSIGAPIAPNRTDLAQEGEAMCVSWVAASVVPFEQSSDGAPQQINVSPRLPGARIILLGEAHKYATVSTYRFARVSVIGATGALELVLRGNVDEQVVLRYVEIIKETQGEGGDAAATAPTLGPCKTKQFRLTQNGESVVSLTPNLL